MLHASYCMVCVSVLAIRLTSTRNTWFEYIMIFFAGSSVVLNLLTMIIHD